MPQSRPSPFEGKKGDGPYGDGRHVAIQPITYHQYGQIVPIKMMRDGARRN